MHYITKVAPECRVLRTQEQYRPTKFKPVSFLRANGKSESKIQIRGSTTFVALRARRPVEPGRLRTLKSLRSGAHASVHPLVATFLAFAFIGAPVAGTLHMHLKFENQTGYSIESIHVVPTARKDWGPNLINDEDYLANGETTDIRPECHAAESYFDLKIRFIGGGEWSWTKDQAFNLLNVSSVSIDSARVVHLMTRADRKL